MILSDNILTGFINTFFNTILEQKIPQNVWDIIIKEERQSTARELNIDGTNKNYVFYRMSPYKEMGLESSSIISTGLNTAIERTTAQREFTVTVTILGRFAYDIHAYFLHAFNSHLYVDGEVGTIGKIHWYSIDEQPQDLTTIENFKWLKRIQFTLTFNFETSEDFPIDFFDKIEVPLKTSGESSSFTQTIDIPKKGDQ